MASFIWIVFWWSVYSTVLTMISLAIGRYPEIRREPWQDVLHLTGYILVALTAFMVLHR